MIYRYPRILASALALSVAVTGASAQDVIYSLADYMPTWTNPAHAGAFFGTARVGGLYRDQSRGFNAEAFQTPGFYIDAPLITLGKKKTMWLGAAGTLISDTRGLAELNSTYATLTASFHTILDQTRDSRTVLSFGLQGGVVQRRANLMSEDILLQEEQEVAIGGGGLGIGGGNDRGMMSELDANGVEIGVGASLGMDLDEDRSLRFGATVRHIIPADVRLVRQGQDYDLPLLFNVQAQYRQVLDDALVVQPSLYVQGRANTLTAQVQSLVGMYFGEGKREERKLISVGVGYRVPQQVYPMVAFETGGLRVAAAFDIYVGGAQGVIGGSATNDSGINASDKLFNSAFEIGAQYILKIYKKPKVEAVILCPQI